MQIGERAYKSLSPTIRESRDKKRVVFRISTDSKDRHETSIDIDGIDVSSYMTNPVVLFNHDYDKVIGRGVDVQKRGNHLYASVEFDEEDPIGANVSRKVRSGFINGASIGFIVREWTIDEESDTMRITQCELVEFSIVAVPSNRDALVVSRDLRQQVESLQSELEHLKAARQAPAEPAEEASAEAPADPAADAVPEPEAAKHETPEPETERAAPQPARSATTADYEAMARAMQPVILQSVLRALGKA